MQTTLKRNELGLLEGIEYKFNPDGTVNWRAMIEPQFLVVKKESKDAVEKQFGKKTNEIDLREVEDRHILILLGGIKKLAQLRGVKSVKQKLEYCSNDKSACVCEIEFIPNFENSNQSYIFSDVGSASFFSTTGEFQLVLEAIAANRAFVRCVRNALGINIVGRDEIDDTASAKAREKSPLQQKEESEDSNSSGGFKPQDTLKTLCQQRKISFEDIKKAALAKVGEFSEKPEIWKDFSDIPSLDCFTILNKLHSADEKKGKS